MKPGKLPHKLLDDMLARLPADDESVVIGPRVGEDAAAVELGGRLLVAASDPITFATELIGWYAVHVNANDIAVMGAVPRWFLGTLLLPPAAEEGDVAAVFDQIVEACRELGVAPIGGHTEITRDIARPILVGCMLGEVARESVLTSSGARPGDVLILSGEIAIEGTAILAREAGHKLREMGMDAGAIGCACDLLFEPGISVVDAARSAAEAGGVTAMHDPTEGGLTTGLRELALASGVGIEVEAEKVPILPLTRQACDLLGLAPLGLIASGSLLIAAEPKAADRVVTALREASHDAAVIGRMLPQEEGLWLVRRGERVPLSEFARDEVARFFDRETSSG
jgi:hydrogenase expression/formation protein HypE